MPQDLSAVGWPVPTERLLLRTATPDDVDATWRIRRIPSVSHWLTSAAGDPDSYGSNFLDPDRLARTLVIELDSVVVGDLMLAVKGCPGRTRMGGPNQLDLPTPSG